MKKLLVVGLFLAQSFGIYATSGNADFVDFNTAEMNERGVGEEANNVWDHIRPGRHHQARCVAVVKRRHGRREGRRFVARGQGRDLRMAKRRACRKALMKCENFLSWRGGRGHCEVRRGGRHHRDFDRDF